MPAHTEQVSYGELDQAYIARLEATTADDDAPFLMLNLMHYRARAVYPVGHLEAGSARTGREADDLYAPLEILHDLGAEVVLYGDVAAQVGGVGPWDRVAMVRYPSIRSFLDMQERPDFIARHVHKDAGMQRTIIALCRPVGGTVAGSRRLQVELLGPGDLPDPGAGRLVLAVDGVPVGDGRAWSGVLVTALDATLDADQAVVAPAAGAESAVVVDALIQALP